MKKLWKNHKLLVLGAPCILIAAVVLFVLYLQMRRNGEIAESVEAGNQYLSDLNYEQAIASYKQALDIDERNKAASLGLAEAYDASDMDILAEEIYQNMLEIDDRQADVYEKLSELYIRQEKLEEAKKLLEEAMNKVEDETVTQLYYVTRPEPPTMSYDSGRYSDRIQVEIQPSEEFQTIYYTLDGSEPTRESFLYEEPLILKNGKTTVKAIVVNDTGYQSDIAVSEYDVTIQDVMVTLEEPVIERIIRDRLGIPYGEPIYNDDIEQITELYIVGEDMSMAKEQGSVYLEEGQFTWDGYQYPVYERGQIKTLNDIQYMPFLERVAVAYQPELDISILSSCDSIRELSLVHDNLSSQDISVLSGLTGLTALNLGWNHIHSIEALSGLSGLTSLALWGNQISDLNPVTGITGLTYLDFSDNQVSDLTPVSGLSNLTQLWMYHNNVKDISSLSGLAKLQVLMLRDNPVENPEAVRSIYPHLTRIDVDLLKLGGV